MTPDPDNLSILLVSHISMAMPLMGIFINSVQTNMNFNW